MSNPKLVKVDQPSALPTRKIFIGAATALATGVLLQAVGDVGQAIPAIAPYMDQIKVFVPIGVGYGASYFVRDRAPS